MEGCPPQERCHRIGYVPQQRVFDRDIVLRGRDLVRLGLDGHRWGFGRFGPEDRARVDASLAEVGATAYADAPVGRLSGGEQQRLRVAQALVADPVLILADEPLLSLDLAHQRGVVDLLDARRESAGTPVVFVTHDVNPVLHTVDRVLYLAPGSWAIGTPDEVLTSGDALEPLRTPTSTCCACAAASSWSARRTTSTSTTWRTATDVHAAARRATSSRHALWAGAVVAVVSGAIGVFVVARGMSFAVHAISELGFTGAAGALVIGIDPVIGILGGSLLVGLVLGLLSLRGRERDSAIGAVLAFGLGLGVLFLSLYQGYATEATNLLFGSIVGVSDAQLRTLAIVGAVVLRRSRGALPAAALLERRPGDRGRRAACPSARSRSRSSSCSR